MRISDWSPDVCSSDLSGADDGLSAVAGRQSLAEASAWRARGLRPDACPISPPDRRCRIDGDGGRAGDRKSVVSGKSVSVRVDLGGRRIIKKKQTGTHEYDL